MATITEASTTNVYSVLYPDGMLYALGAEADIGDFIRETNQPKVSEPLVYSASLTRKSMDEILATFKTLGLAGFFHPIVRSHILSEDPPTRYYVQSNEPGNWQEHLGWYGFFRPGDVKDIDSNLQINLTELMKSR